MSFQSPSIAGLSDREQSISGAASDWICPNRHNASLSRLRAARLYRSEQGHLAGRSLGNGRGNSELATVELGANLAKTELTGCPRKALRQQIGVGALTSETVVEPRIVELPASGLPDHAEDMTGTVRKMRVQPGFEHLAQLLRQP
jgi:hypothetical protein